MKTTTCSLLLILILTIVNGIVSQVHPTTIDTEPEGCSLKFDGSSFLSVERFVSDRRHKGILFDPSAGAFEAWIKPSPYLLGEHTKEPGVILQTGIIWSTKPMSFAMKFDRGSLWVEKWTRNGETWSVVTVHSTSVEYIPAEQWTHVAFDIATSSLMINGHVHIPRTTISSVHEHPSYRFSIGANFTGSIDEIRIWNSSKTARDVQAFMKTTICPSTIKDGSLILHLSFDECGQNTNITLDNSQARACAKMRPNAFMFYKKHHKRHQVGELSDIKYPVSYRLVDAGNIPTFNHSRFGESFRSHNFGKKGEQHEHKDGHKGECKHKKWGGDLSLVYDTPSPTVSWGCFEVMDAATQCPYAEFHRRVHPTHHSSEDDGDDSDDSDDDDEFDFSLIWICLTIFVLMSCASYCRRMKNRRNAANNVYQALPQSGSVQQEFDGYPGAYYAVPQPQQQVPQPQQPVYGPVPFYDPRMFYMYHMPQMQVPAHMQQAPHLAMPVYYSPNQPANQEGADGQL